RISRFRLGRPEGGNHQGGRHRVRIITLQKGGRPDPLKTAYADVVRVLAPFRRTAGVSQLVQSPSSAGRPTSRLTPAVRREKPKSYRLRCLPLLSYVCGRGQLCGRRRVAGVPEPSG